MNVYKVKDRDGFELELNADYYFHNEYQTASFYKSGLSSTDVNAISVDELLCTFNTPVSIVKQEDKE